MLQPKSEYMYVKIQNWDVTNENFRILMCEFLADSIVIFNNIINLDGLNRSEKQSKERCIVKGVGNYINIT
jgi:hypothetical protein